MAKNVFSIDVEDYFQVESMSGVVSRDDWDGIETRVEANTHKILDMLAEQGIHGTFFVLGWVAERHPELVKAIAAQGHEIASHGMSHRMVYTQTPEVFREETRRSKALLEDICQTEVKGYRAATYSITEKSLWALDILVEEGFQYDSSIFPMRHDRYGIPDINRNPHVIHTNSGDIVEIPITIYEKNGIKIPCAGGGYFRLFPYWLTRFCLSGVEHEREFNFYLHPWEVDPGQPRYEDAGWFSKFRHYNNLDKCEARLRRLLSDFEFTTAEDMLRARNLLQ